MKVASSSALAHYARRCIEFVRWGSVPAFFLLLALLKLSFISNHEIIAAYRPHDDYWHILAADSWVWGRPYNEWTLMHLPVYALFIAITGTTGIPLRISIEAVYIACAAVLSSSLTWLGLSGPLRAVVFGLLIFHPYSYDSFDYSGVLFIQMMEQHSLLHRR